MYFKLPPLPFKATEVSAWISSETLDFHHGRHHRAYVEKLNALLKGSGLETASLEEIVQRSDGALYNNAAQAWNHTFYWLGIGSAKDRADFPKKYPELHGAIIKSFGSLETMLSEFSRAAVSLFGSGWVWLVQDMKSGKLEIAQTSNAGNPLKDGKKPLLVCDVWEHAYYIDFRNARSKYVEGFVNAINWPFVAQNHKHISVRDLTKIMKGVSETPTEILKVAG